MEHFRNIVMNLLCLVLMWISISRAASAPISLPLEFSETRWNSTVTDPFGFVQRYCSFNASFTFIMLSKNIPFFLSNMSFEDGTLSASVSAAYDSYDTTGQTDSFNQRFSLVIAGVILMVIIIGLLIFVMLKRRRKENNLVQNGGLLLTHQRIRIFSEAELVKATKNYDTTNFLGEGGFGKVYRGILDDEKQVAVKKPKGVDKGPVNQEFQREIAIVSQVNHKNVVKLLGLCIETAIPLLVYELISNGTLSQHIHGKKSNILQTWKARLRVASETALALDYLHSLADPPIIHSDIKSANILLDDNYTAKVSDFGASILISADEAIMASKIQGTLGYLDPEYLMTGILTTKSDVYSFGILLAELLTGVNPSSASRSKAKGNIVDFFLSSLKSNNLFSILDFQVIDNDDREEIKVVALLAKTCIDISGIRRPTMKEVVEKLVGLRKLRKDIAMQQNNDETEHSLGESSTSYFSATMQNPNIYMSAFEIESNGYSIDETQVH